MESCHIMGCDLVPTQMHLEDTAAAAAKSLQSCLTLCDPMDCSLPGSSVHGSFQARVLEWGAITLASHISYDFILSSLLDFCITCTLLGLPQWLSGKESVCNAGEKCSIPGLGRNLGGVHGNPFQYIAWRFPWKREPGGLQSLGS